MLGVLVLVCPLCGTHPPTHTLTLCLPPFAPPSDPGAGQGRRVPARVHPEAHVSVGKGAGVWGRCWDGGQRQPAPVCLHCPHVAHPARPRPCTARPAPCYVSVAIGTGLATPTWCLTLRPCTTSKCPPARPPTCRPVNAHSPPCPLAACPAACRCCSVVMLSIVTLCCCGRMLTWHVLMWLPTLSSTRPLCSPVPPPPLPQVLSK